MTKKWTQQEDDFLSANYKTLTMAELAVALNRTQGQVRGRKSRLGNLNKSNGENLWTNAETKLLKDFYLVAGRSAPINLGAFAMSIGKEASNVCRKALSLGLPVSKSRSKRNEAVWAQTVTVTEKIKAQPWTLSSGRKQGYYSINGRQVYLRSSWEAGYAHYLDWLVEAKQIERWEYETDTFWFEKIRRGVRSYTPDFKVFGQDASIEYHEVKGWMDSRSKTKLNRMRIYHPKVKIVLVDKPVFNALKSQFPALFTVQDPTPKDK